MGGRLTGDDDDGRLGSSGGRGGRRQRWEYQTFFRGGQVTAKVMTDDGRMTYEQRRQRVTHDGNDSEDGRVTLLAVLTVPVVGGGKYWR